MRHSRALVVASLAAAAVAAGLALALRPASSSEATPSPRSVGAVLATRLRAQHLSFRWVACLRNGRSYQGRAIVRCNVNFGDPHIVAYCAIVVGSRVVTNHEDARVPCGSDRAGFYVTTISSR